MADGVGQALAGLVPRVGRDDWDDVLRRSEERRPRRAVLVLAVVGCLLVAIPAVAAPKLWRSLSAAKAPSAELWATLRLPDGRPAGTLELALPGALWSNPRSHLRLPRRLVRTAHGVRLVNTFVVRWRLEVTALGGRADRGVFYIRRNVAHAGTEVATLCRPCRSGDEGRLRLTLHDTVALINDQLAFALATGSSPRAATGPVVLRR